MSALPDVFRHDPAGFIRRAFPFAGAPAEYAGAWVSTKGAPLGLVAICTDAPHDWNNDQHWWRHVSVSRSDRLPTWNDVRAVKAAFVGDRYAYMVFPDEAHYVSIHDNCLHLYAAHTHDDGNVLPEFTEGSGSI